MGEVVEILDVTFSRLTCFLIRFSSEKICHRFPPLSNARRRLPFFVVVAIVSALALLNRSLNVADLRR